MNESPSTIVEAVNPSKGGVCARRLSVIEDSVLPPTDEFAQKKTITPANTALEVVGARPGTNNMSRMALKTATCGPQ